MKLPDSTPVVLNAELPDSSSAYVRRALPPGTWLEAFELGELIGEGSSTIVYAATDRARRVPVAIAEYMPARLAQRNHEGQVAPQASAQANAFAKGLQAFIGETRTLARCNHPSLLRVARLWEANGTAYRVMPRYAARRLLEVRQGMNEPPDEEAVRALLDALLGALGVYHQAGDGHGRVTPSNILLLDDNRPLLLGPGAAGRALAGDRIDALMTGVEPGFAPIEQMVESADLPLRPSVDLYALAGVARYWISGQLPPPAFGAPNLPRREKLADIVQRLRRTWPQLHYSATLLDALDNALSIYPAERPQGVAQMRIRLGTAPSAANGPAIATRAAIPALSDPVPSDVAPSEVALSEVALSEVAPSEVAPSEVAPSEVAPSEVAPSEVAPSEVAPSEVAPSDVVPSDVVPSDVVPSDVVPSDVVPRDVVPTDVVPTDVVPTDVVPTDVVPNDVVANDTAPNETLPSSPAPVPQPADRAQDFDVLMPVVPDPDYPATAGLARVDARPMEAAFARQVRSPRRIAKWTGATLVLLSLLLIGVFEFGQERQVGGLLEALGVSRGPAVGDGDALPASAVGTAAPAPPQTTADAASVQPMPTEPAVAEPAASATASAVPTSIPDAKVAQPLPTEPAAADAPPGATAPASPAGADRTTQSAAAAGATAEPPASAPAPAAVAPAPKRAKQQQVARAPASPREACGPRTQFSLYRCMKLQCSQQRWAAHAQCKRLRATDSVD